MMFSVLQWHAHMAESHFVPVQFFYCHLHKTIIWLVCIRVPTHSHTHIHTGADIRSVCTEAGMFAIRARRKVCLIIIHVESNVRFLNV